MAGFRSTGHGPGVGADEAEFSCPGSSVVAEKDFYE